MMISFGNPNIFVKILGGRPMVAPTMLYDILLDMKQSGTNRKRRRNFPAALFDYRTYSMTTRRLGSVPVEWVVMFSISCREAWIT